MWKTPKRQFLTVHLALVAMILLFLITVPFLRRSLPELAKSCFVHDYLFLYCPMCGGTRATEALLRLDFGTAFSMNAYVTVLFFVFLGMDITALVRLLRKKDHIFRFPVWIWITLGAGMLAFGAVRNYLMIAHGYDSIGDLAPLWRALTNR